MQTGTRTRVFPRRAIVAQGLPFVGGLALVGVVLTRADPGDVRGLISGLSGIRAWQWALALAFTLLSFVAVGRYDRAVHGWLGTGVAPGAAATSGRAAIAISQMAGMGLITGTLVRWYVLRDLSLARAAALTAVVGSSFLAGLAVVGAALGLVTGALAGPLALAAWVIVALAAALCVACLAAPRIGWARHLPPLPRVIRVIGLVAVDVAAAGAAFMVLLGSADPQVLGAAVLSLGAGLVSSTPFGVGGFEASLALLLPGHDIAALLGAALAFRIVYFAVPASVAVLAILLRPNAFRGTAPAQPIAEPRPGPRILAQIAQSSCAEAGLAVQPGAAALLAPEGRFLSGLIRTRNADIALAAPRGAAPLDALVTLTDSAGRAALAYKIARSDALLARRKGWAVFRVGREAWLCPADFSVEGPAHRQLRRKLRQADKAGIRVEPVAGPLPWAEMTRIDAAWQSRHGAARGASMGRLDRKATARQLVWMAYRHDRPIAFVSFHATPQERTLDLIRYDGTVPDGTIHALVVRAIADAAAAGIPRVSLAAVPDPHVPAWLKRRFETATGARGLAQFKSAFAPHWTPVYAAAPTLAALALGLFELLREIAWPPAPNA